jgi:PPK2 family polyphosphate:nucleotide phosphotransferase
MDAYRIRPGMKVNLDDWDPRDNQYFQGGKDEAAQKLAVLNEELEALQEILFAEGKQKILIALQGMDTSGKDGVIRHVFEGVNPQGMRVANFKVPTQIELAHDYLWRVHQQTPGSGELVIFNRSHYEEVLVVRVHSLVPEKIWARRYDQINAFEEILASAGTTILKFFLHISLDEQRERLQARLDDPTKRWKFRLGDLDERKLWTDYQKAYEEVLNRTNTETAPWYIVPSDRKWYRNLVIGEVIVQALKKLDMKYPQPEENLDGVVVV